MKPRLLTLLVSVLTISNFPLASGGATLVNNSSPNVELVRHVEVAGGTGGGRFVGHYFFASTSTGLAIYDIADPTRPKQVGRLGDPSTTYAPFSAQEDPETNGRIFLADRPSALTVVDVSDVRNPHIVGELDTYQHTWSCVADCTYAYGADGAIVDLTNPRKPREVGNWQQETGINGAHDVTSVSRDLTVVSTTPLRILDVSDPRRPRLLAQGQPQSVGFQHGNLWPRHGKDRFLIAGTENAYLCNLDPAFITTFDTRGWKQTGTFRPVDEYRVPEDPDQASPVNTFCGHWFDTHPDFHDGGLIAAGWYEDGMRLLEVDSTGHIEEKGYFMRELGASSAAYWAARDLVYVTDYNEGFDVLRVKT